VTGGTGRALDVAAETSAAVPLALRRAVRQYGRHSYVQLLLEPGIEHHTLRCTDGFVGFISAGSVAVSLGDPVCPPEDTRMAVQEFVAAAAERGRDVVFVPVTQTFVEATRGDHAVSIAIGDEFLFDVRCYRPTGQRAKKVRCAVHQVRRRGATVHEYLAPPLGPSNPTIECAIRAVAERWRVARSRRAHGQLLAMNLFDAHRPRRYFHVDFAGRLVAFLTCAPIPARNGYLFEDLVRDLDAPNGCSELLVLEALEAFRGEGIDWATLGVSPRISIPDIKGLKWFTALLVRAAVEFAERRGGLQALHHYRKKFDTGHVERVWLVKYPNRLRARDLVGILRAFRLFG
jgi:phosphatidylglycerol lysyltransferase